MPQSNVTVNPGRIPDDMVWADLPTCDPRHMCSWGYSAGRFWLKYINRSCALHGKLPSWYHRTRGVRMSAEQIAEDRRELHRQLNPRDLRRNNWPSSRPQHYKGRNGKAHP